jgi:hypothetical protein
MILDLDALLATDPAAAPPGREIGRSREGRPILAWRFGDGRFRVSLLAGCHADEPVGPRLLRHLVARLAELPEAHPALTTIDWWIVPHANPDGEARNATWAEPLGESVDPIEYLRNVVREPPGEDVEFGFPRDEADDGARPENRALAAWWRGAGGSFRLHASLHGMAVAHGPWFLVERSWWERAAPFAERCRSAARSLGYPLHDVDRRGEKGFERLGPGFSSRPDSRAMARHFRERGDDATAALFRPSSMETIRALGGDALTLVSEMPLFRLPPRSPGAGPATGDDSERWRERFAIWSRRLREGGGESTVRREIAPTGLEPMPVRDQLALQWIMIAAGIETLAERDA